MMKRILLASTIALLATGGAAVAQTAEQTGDASATGGQGGIGYPTRMPAEPYYYEPAPGVTTGMAVGTVIVQPAPMREVPAGPIKSPSDGDSLQGNVGPGTGYYYTR
jgi:hypothetical protein